MSGRLAITEESGVHKEWKVEVDDMTMEKLPAFLRKLTEDYDHDYGTICHAIAAGAIATAKAMNRTPNGGITGFQAGCIMWQMAELWGVWDKGPKRLLSYENLLYPQYSDKFRTIPRDTWEWAQAQAKEKLARDDLENVSPNVVKHWKSIALGNIPFGLKLEARDVE